MSLIDKPIPIYGLGENTEEPGSKETTITIVTEGFTWIVSCMDAGFFRVPEAKAVSNGMLLFMSALVRKLNSKRDICSLLKTFLNSVPEITPDKCVSNIATPPKCLGTVLYSAQPEIVKQALK